MSLKNFGLSATALEEWLPWGGIIQPHVMKQKDSSLFAVLQYLPYTLDLSQEKLQLPDAFPFSRGWVLYNEHQHKAGEADGNDYLVICWNPFVSPNKRYVENSLPHERVDKNETITYFTQTIERFRQMLLPYTEAEFLTYQDLMDFLSFSFTHGMHYAEMPEIPLYMDVLLSQDAKMTFGDNDIYLDGQRLFLVRMLSAEPADIATLYDALTNLTFRHTQRLLLFSQKEAQKDLTEYLTTKIEFGQRTLWCPSRKILRREVVQGLLGKYNGYYTNLFQFFLPQEDDERFRSFFARQLNQLQCSYIAESYHLKEAFWGSIPGLFLADIQPPVIGFSHLSEFLTAQIKRKPPKQDILEDAKARLVPTSVDVQQYFMPKTERTDAHVPA